MRELNSSSSTEREIPPAVAEGQRLCGFWSSGEKLNRLGSGCRKRAQWLGCWDERLRAGTRKYVSGKGGYNRHERALWVAYYKGGLQLGLKEAGRRGFLAVEFDSLSMLVTRQRPTGSRLEKLHLYTQQALGCL